MAFETSPIRLNPAEDRSPLFQTTFADNLASINANTPDYTQLIADGNSADRAIKRYFAGAEAAGKRILFDANTRLDIADKQNKAALDVAEEKNQFSFGKTLLSAGTTLASAALTLSDERTKNTITKIEDALSTLRELKPVTFYYNEEYSSNPERIHNGFIAQDYAKVLPAATYYDDSLDRLCIDTNELIALLVRAVQQLESRVTRMEAKNVLEKV